MGRGACCKNCKDNIKSVFLSSKTIKGHVLVSSTQSFLAEISRQMQLLSVGNVDSITGWRDLNYFYFSVFIHSGTHLIFRVHRKMDNLACYKIRHYVHVHMELNEPRTATKHSMCEM